MPALHFLNKIAAQLIIYIISRLQEFSCVLLLEFLAFSNTGEYFSDWRGSMHTPFYDEEYAAEDQASSTPEKLKARQVLVTT